MLIEQCRRWTKAIVCGLPGVLLAPWAFAYQAHYFVIEEAVDGKLSVAFHQLVEISGTPESSSPAGRSSERNRQVTHPRLHSTSTLPASTSTIPAIAGAVQT